MRSLLYFGFGLSALIWVVAGVILLVGCQSTRPAWAEDCPDYRVEEWVEHVDGMTLRFKHTICREF